MPAFHFDDDDWLVKCLCLFYSFTWNPKTHRGFMSFLSSAHENSTYFYFTVSSSLALSLPWSLEATTIEYIILHAIIPLFSLSTLWKQKKLLLQTCTVRGAPFWNIIIIKPSNNNFPQVENLWQSYRYFHDNISLFVLSVLYFFFFFSFRDTNILPFLFLQVWHAPGLPFTLLSPPQQSLWWHSISSS